MPSVARKSSPIPSFSLNTATNEDGGGIYAKDVPNLTVNNSTLTGNTAGLRGGALSMRAIRL